MKFELIEYDQLSSTNTEAIRLYQSGKSNSGMVIVTREQTGGKGYGNSHWESEPGKNLTFSLLIKPDFIEPSTQFFITQIISLSIWEVLDSILRKKTVSIKWPNDIYVGDKKIAGILIQNYIKGKTIDISIIGVGLNVSQKEFISDAPNPTSIVLESGMNCPLDNLLEDILETFGAKISSCQTKSTFAKLNKQYLDKLYRFGKKARFKDEQGIFEASIAGISEYGQLKLIDESRAIRDYNFKEIEFV